MSDNRPEEIDYLHPLWSMGYYDGIGGCDCFMPDNPIYKDGWITGEAERDAPPEYQGKGLEYSRQAVVPFKA